MSQNENILTWEQSIDALNNERITLQDFINMNASHTLYYSTPVGENKDGKTIMWLINNSRLNMSFYPTFMTRELCQETLSAAGRINFIIIEGTLESALSSLDTNPILQNAGLLIQDTNGRLAIPPKMRVGK